MDPIWSLSNNRLTFVNSIKMKMSVIFGVFHMTIGILIKGLNTIYFGQNYPKFDYTEGFRIYGSVGITLWNSTPGNDIQALVIILDNQIYIKGQLFRKYGQ